MGNSRGKASWRALGACIVALAGLCLLATDRAQALSTADFLASLSESEANAFQSWKLARMSFDAELDAYWDQVDAKRQQRKKKRAASIPFELKRLRDELPAELLGSKPRRRAGGQI